MEQPQDKSIIDFILKDHKRRFEEAEILCRNRSFFPSRRPPHVCAEAISSTPKRPPSTSVYWFTMELMLAEPSSASLAPRLRELINSLISELKIIKHYDRLVSNSLVLEE